MKGKTQNDLLGKLFEISTPGNIQFMLSYYLMNKLKNFLFIVLTSFFFLFFLEITIRTLNPREESSRTKTSYNHKFGHYLKGSDWIKLPVKNGKLNINYGLFFLKKDIGIERVLFIGDSGTRGVGLDEEKIFTTILQKKFLRRAEIINAGVPGSNNVNQLMLLDNKFHLLKPDHIFLGIFLANDINFNLLNYDPIINNSWGHRFYESLRNTSALINFLHYRLIGLVKRSELFDSMSNEELWPTSWLKTQRGLHYINYIEGEYSLYLKDNEPLVEKSYVILEDLLLKFKSFTKERNIEFSVILFPSPSTVLNKAYFGESDIVHHINKRFNISEDDLDFQRPLNKTIEICNRLKIKCINPLQKLKPLGLKAFLEDDHFSALGHDVLYRIISEQLDPILPIPQ